MQKTCSNFTNILKILAIVSFIAISFFVFKSTSNAETGINRQINFQGKLVNTDGTNVANANYTIVFSFYGFDSGSTAVWTESQSIAVTDGIFQAALGSVTPIPASFNFNWDGLYLGIKVGADNEMEPRIRISAVPFAFNAEKVAGLTVQDENGVGSTSGILKIPNGKTIAFAGATSFGAGTTGLITLGSNTDTLAFTTSGATSVALPTGGTLLTNTIAAVQTITSTQTSGTILGITDSTALAGAIKGAVITLSGANAQDQTGLEFNLSNATGTNLNDIVGTGSTWKVSKGGALTVTSCLGCGAVGSTNNWGIVEGLLFNGNLTTDFAIGGSSTDSAQFSISGISNNQAIASLSGNLIVMPNNGWGGMVGIGTTNPGANLEVLGTDTSVASVSAITSGNGLTFTANGGAVIQSLINGTLTIGGDTTGNIVFSPNNGSGIVTIGSTTNGLVFDVTNGGPTYYGNSRPTKTIVLSPEYSGATLTASGSAATDGSMTSDNSLNAGGVGWKNYYQWSSTNASVQDYTVAVRATLPSDFDSWQTGACPGTACALEIAYQTGVSGITNNNVSAWIDNAESTPAQTICSITPYSSTTWSSFGCTSTNLATSPGITTAGSTAIILIRLQANSTASALARVGDITLRYYAKF